MGERICRMRTALGLSQEALAERLEVSRQSVSKWETNASVPELDKLIKMCELFGVTLDELVTGKQPSAPTGSGRLNTGKIAALLMLVFCCVTVIVTVLFGNAFGIHTHEGLLLAGLFALIGMIALDPKNQNRKRLCLRIYVPTAVMMLALDVVFWLGATIWFILGYGLVLTAWTVYQRRK